MPRCRMCQGSKLAKFLDLGSMPPADQFLTSEQLASSTESYPLEVMNCDDCGLVQLSEVVPPEILYCDNYPYESSTTSAGRTHWAEFASTVTRALKLGRSDLVLDIGSNVGVLLSSFQKLGPRVLGVDPADNIAQIARTNGIATITGFFNADTAQVIRAEHGQASAITATNVFAHVDDLTAFMRAIDVVLKPDGVLIIEAPYLLHLLEDLEYDTIYHEHLSYLSIKPMQRFFIEFNMEIFDVQRRDIHGGSFRVFVQRVSENGRAVAPIVADLVAEEERTGAHDRANLLAFAKRVAAHRNDLRTLLLKLKGSGKRIAAVSAPAKGMTLLNYCGLDRTIIDFVTEKSSLKIGRFTPGMNIPVVSDAHLLEEQPDYALLLAWNFAEEIMRNLSDFSEGGGRFIIPIPHPKIIG